TIHQRDRVVCAGVRAVSGAGDLEIRESGHSRPRYPGAGIVVGFLEGCVAAGMGESRSTGAGCRWRCGRSGKNAALAGEAMALDSAADLVWLAVGFRDAKCGRAFNGGNTLATGRLCGVLFSGRAGDWE